MLIPHRPDSGAVLEGSLVPAARSAWKLLSFAASGIFLKWERAAQPALKHSVDMEELMTLAQPSRDPRPPLGGRG